MATAFKKAESKIPKKKKRRTLGDVDVLDIVEDLCTKDKFDG